MLGHARTTQPDIEPCTTPRRQTGFERAGGGVFPLLEACCYSKSPQISRSGLFGSLTMRPLTHPIASSTASKNLEPPSSKENPAVQFCMAEILTLPIGSLPHRLFDLLLGGDLYFPSVSLLRSKKKSIS